jgi:hypothetical protein
VIRYLEPLCRAFARPVSSIARFSGCVSFDLYGLDSGTEKKYKETIE